MFETDIVALGPHNTETILYLKDELLTQWQQLPPEHQASMSLVLIRTVMDGEWGAWLKEAVARQHLHTAQFPSVNRDALRAVDLTEEDIAQLSDDDAERDTVEKTDQNRA